MSPCEVGSRACAEESSIFARWRQEKHLERKINVTCKKYLDETERLQCRHCSQSLYELFLMPTWQENYGSFRTGTWFSTSFGKKKLFSYANRKFIVIPKFNVLVNSSIVSAFKMIHRRPNILLLLLLPMIVVTVVGDSHSRLKSPCIWRASHKVAALMNIVAGVITHRQMNVLWHFYVHLFDSHKNRIELLRKKKKKKCFHSDSNWKRKKK